jgi:hypothetical protein
MIRATALFQVSLSTLYRRSEDAGKHRLLMLRTLLVRKVDYRGLRSRELITPILLVSKPSFIVPFLRDSKFVGREDILADINRRHKQANSQGHTSLALVGLGGVG